MSVEQIDPAKTKRNDVIGQAPILDVEKSKEELVKARDKRCETIDFMTTWEEQEKRKFSVRPPDTQKK